MPSFCWRRILWGRGDAVCWERGPEGGPQYPYPIPPPRRGLSPGALVTRAVPCILCCVRVRQDGDGDRVRKQDGHGCFQTLPLPTVSGTCAERRRGSLQSRGRPGYRPSILMLHGFSAHKDMWLSIVKFVECINLNRRPFHLVGTSMGGNVAGVYAAQYPEDICSLTLICPAGLPSVTDSKFIKQLRELKESERIDRIPLIPSTPEEMADMLKLCSYVRFKVPQQILQGLVDVRIPHNDFYRKLFLEIANEKSRHSLHENMSKIKVPTQVIWGRQDQVLDVSGANVLSSAIPDCHVYILENCGHSVVVERPRKTANLILEFLALLHNTDNNKKQA
ncbi:monoacylglycerol lipase ABHD6 isoform X3 [Strigops habroptila]|uniref:monoacylglycerol lipase ABHD6 isoform X3 n=1 Tax=Strigops habroptila TaxID=2489341 RepID=UPI0011CF56B8|nr:monoacylglycerol lipase ABHD6 isoform X3 [Strigops habroptila]